MKLIVREPGTTEAFDIWSSAERVVSSILLYPETRSALGRAARLRRFDRREAAAARTIAEKMWNDIDRIGVTVELAQRAGEIAEVYALRAFDAVHLAAAESVASDELVLAAGDRDLLEAASASGLATAPLA